ncbi:peptidase S8 [Solihabitans fulvus]|uniref:Peptidase S8 n=1 Tax=Solihabitans fulvus TaxID=1892852 RepID=A0A5B2XEG6_9PSEU|nr:peptidase S8 [Solihabitans fulvus]
MSKRAVAALITSVPLLVLATGLTAQADPQANLVPLTANAAPGLEHATKTGPEDANKQLPVAVSLNLRNQAELDSLLAKVTNPHSAEYGHYLTPDQFRDRFAPTQAQVDAVANHLRAAGLKVTGSTANRLAVDATGTATQIQSAFGTSLSRWHDATQNRDFTANDSAPRLPKAVASLVSDVAGLNDHYTRHHAHAQTSAPHVGSGPSGGYTPDELRGAYNIDKFVNAGTDGSGQQVAMFEFADYQQANITAYDQQYGTGSPTPTRRNVDGGNTTLGNAQVEVELDIEVAHAIAPKANVAVYEAPNTDAGEVDMWNALVSDNVPVISSSWGQCELDKSSSSMTAVDNVAKQAAAQGQTFLSAAGDSGAYDCERNQDANSTKLAVDFPGSDPYVTSVGGTTLSMNGTSYGSETTWNESGGWSGGGGVSSVFAKPSWQTGSGVTSSNKRQVPDVSAAAAGGEYSIYTQGSWTTVGGTSAATPLWAGYLTLHNQKAVAAGKAKIGAANAAIYSVANSSSYGSTFHDVTSGTNRYYSAGANFDLASGWGTPVADALSTALLGGGSTTPPPSGGIANGDFETGSLTGWTAAGPTSVVNSGTYAGSYSAQVGSVDPAGDSSIAQTFTAPTGTSSLSFAYNVVCNDSVTYDWATATLKDNTAGTTKTVLAKTCTLGAGWKTASASVVAGHSYTLTLANHDDNYAGDPTYTLYDGVKLG